MEALGQVLTSWSKDDDEQQLDYPEVLSLLREDDADSDTLYAEYGILVWDKFEDEDPEWVADQIESLYNSYLAIARYASGAVKEN